MCLLNFKIHIVKINLKKICLFFLTLFIFCNFHIQVTNAYVPENYGYVRICAAVPEIKVADVDFNVNEIINLVNQANERNVS